MIEIHLSLVDFFLQMACNVELRFLFIDILNMLLKNKSNNQTPMWYKCDENISNKLMVFQAKQFFWCKHDQPDVI